MFGSLRIDGRRYASSRDDAKCFKCECDPEVQSVRKLRRNTAMRDQRTFLLHLPTHISKSSIELTGGISVSFGNSVRAERTRSLASLKVIS
jgi:hypothetical protein